MRFWSIASTAIILEIAFFSAAFAQDATPSRQCYQAANFYEAAAKARDSGITEAASASEIINKKFSKEKEQQLLEIIHAVYSPRFKPLSPKELSDASIAACVANK